MTPTVTLAPCSNDLAGLPPADQNKNRQAFMLFEPLSWFENRVQAAASQPDALSEIMHQSADEFERPWSLFLRHDGDIGSYLRWLVALKLLLRLASSESSWPTIVCNHNHSRYAQKTRHSSEKIPARQRIFQIIWPEALTDDLAKAEADSVFEFIFYHNTNTWKTESRYADGDLFARILKAIAKHCAHRASPLSINEFLSVHNGVDWSIAEDNPLQRFESWLLRGLHPPKVNRLEGLMCEYLLPSTERSAQLTRVIDRLLSPHSKPIVNIHARSCWSGLRAFATSAAKALTDARSASGRNVGLLYVRLSRAGLVDEPATLWGLINYLNEAFGIPAEREQNSRPVHLHHDLLPLRRALTIHPTVLIFDALDNGAGPMSALLDLIRNSFLPDMLRVLCQPEFDTRRTQGAPYLSRLLVLSGEPLQEFDAWCVAEALVAPPKDAAERLYRPRLEDDEQLETVTNSLRARRSAAGLANLYPLEDLSILPLLVEACGPASLPSETDFAIASLLPGRTVISVYRSGLHAGSGGATRFRHALFAAWFRAAADNDPIGLLAIQFIALSMNGLRFETLPRCLGLWLERVKLRGTADQARRLQSDVDIFLTSRKAFLSDPSTLMTIAAKFKQLLVEGEDDEVEALGSRQSEYELELRPCHTITPRQRLRLLDVRSHEIRDLLVAQMLAEQENDAGTPRRAWFLDGSWELIQSILTDEALRQGTVLVRTLPLAHLAHLSVLRRFVQAIVHGLLIFSDASTDDIGHFPMSPGGTVGISPADNLNRRRYLYLFVYKKLIENAPVWSLSRAYGRAELRFALLVMFCSKPAELRSFFAMASRNQKKETVRWESLSSTLSRDNTWVSDALGSPLHADYVLRIEMIEALCRAAYDLGMHQFVENVLKGPRSRKRLLSLNEQKVSSAVLPTTGPAFALRKIEIDSYLATLHLTKARSACETELKKRGIEPGVYEGLHLLYPKANVDRSQPLDTFHTALRERAGRIEVPHRGTESLQAVAALLARRAEIAATEADNDPAWINQGGAFLAAYGIFFLADCIRQRLGTTGSDWGAVSARIMRYWIRVTFKLAKILSLHEAAPGTESVAFFVQARHYTDLYSRHLFRLPREKLSMLLVLVSATRIWAELDENLSQAEVVRHLNASLDYLTDAQMLLNELGAAPALCSRFFFERYKTLTRLEHRDPQRHTAWQRLADADWVVLEDLSKGSRFWTNLIDRQRKLRESKGLQF